MHPIHHAGFAFVEDQQWMQIAVASVKHVHHQEFVAFDDLVDLLQHFGKASPWHDGVVQVVVRLDASDGTERVLAALPEQGALGLVLGDAYRAGTVCFADLDDPLHIGFDTGR